MRRPKSAHVTDITTFTDFIEREMLSICYYLPEAIHFFFLLEFLDYETKVKYTSCCKRFYYSYMRNYVRRITIDAEGGKWFTSNLEQDEERIRKYISDPALQLNLGRPNY